MSAPLLDLVLVLAIVATAAGFLVWRAFKPAPPACHTIAGARSSTKGPDVVIGAALAKGLKRAQDRARAHGA